VYAHARIVNMVQSAQCTQIRAGLHYTVPELAVLAGELLHLQ